MASLLLAQVLLLACFLKDSVFFNEMAQDREVIKGPLSLGEPKHILVELNKTIEDPAVIAGAHVVLREETGMSFGRSRLRINFVPVKAPDVICNFDHTPAMFDGLRRSWLPVKAPDVICNFDHTPAMFDGNGACKSSDTPKAAISGKHSWSGYCGDLVFWILLIFGVKCLDIQISNKLLAVALIYPLIAGCSATNDCAGVVVEFEFCSEYCNTVHVSPSLNCCIKLSAAASINEKNTSAPCTCHTAKLVLLYEFCGIPVNQFPYMCKGAVLPPLQQKLASPPATTDKTPPKKKLVLPPLQRKLAPPKKKSLLASLWGCYKVGVYIVGSLLTLCAGGLGIWLQIRKLVLNRPGDEDVGTQPADLASATSNLSSGLTPA